MQRVDTDAVADRFTENATISFAIRAGGSCVSHEYPLTRSGELTSIKIDNLFGPASVSIWLGNEDVNMMIPRIVNLDISMGDTTFIDPGRWIEFYAGDVLTFLVTQRDPDTDVAANVTVELSYQVAT